MAAAVARIRRAVKDGEKVAVYGDYDVDGLTSSALMSSWLRDRGLECVTYIPERLTEGYGISAEALTGLAEQKVTLLVTVDCGVTATEQLKHAASLGIDVVVTDHHECPCELPQAVAVVNPHRRDDTYPFKGLAGVGVAFKVVCALEGQEAAEDLLQRYGALVALGTIADIMPVTEENRVLIRRGIWMLQHEKLPGLDSLMAESNVDKKRVCGTDISFSIVPRLNAAGRMGRVRAAFDLLMAREREEGIRLASELSEMNCARRTVEERVFADALEMLGDVRHLEAPIVLASDSWHHGVSGIVASRLAERFGVPAVIICIEGEEGRGSCRSYGGFPIFDALEASQDVLTGFGGHELAAGLTLRSDRVDELRQRLADYYLRHEGERVQQRIQLDFCVEDPDLLTIEEIDALRQMSPWGVGNPPPMLCLRDVRVESVTPIGGNRHLKLSGSKNGRRFECVFFGMTVRELGLRGGLTADLAFEPDVNEFRGNRTVQLLLRDARPSRMPQDPSLQMADRFFRGEALSPMERALLLPDRSDLGRVWMYLCRRARRFDEETETLLPDIALRTGLSAQGRVLVCLRVFAELSLLTLTETDGVMEIVIPRFEGKADLNDSAILKRLR